MNNKEKKLLIKDLSARLPYGVKFLRESWNYEWDQELSVVETLEDIDKDGYINNTKVYNVQDIKPFLRPMSSMTEEEIDKLAEFHIWNDDEKIFPDCNCKLSDIVSAMNWLNKKMFDYRGLIEKGLALEAPEGMYNED